jgi:hypothetical protein
MIRSLRQARYVAGIITASAAVTLGALAGTASAATAPTGAVSGHATAKHEYCAVVLAPQRSARSAQHVVKRTCSTQHAVGSVRPEGYSAATGYLIFTEYQYTNYTGNYVAFYETSACPSRSTTGWALPNTQPSHWGAGSWGASSWKASNGCWATTLYYGLEFGGPKYQYTQGTYEAGQIGAPWGNHVWSVWTGYQR